MTTATVSVVIATYNYARFLPEAVESVLRQTMGDFELIVVDDGSTDETPAVLESYQIDPRVQVLWTPRRGPSAARNSGIRLAQAPLVAFLDGDDRWHETKLERQLAVFNHDPALGVVFARRTLMDEQGHALVYRQPVLPRGTVLEALFRENFVCFSSSMVRKDALFQAGLFDESIRSAVDYDLWLRVARTCRFDYVDAALVAYRVGHASISRQVLDRHRVVGAVMQRFLDEHGGRALLPASVVRTALADYHASTAGHLRASAPTPVLVSQYARALTLVPWHRPSWRGLLTFWWLDRFKTIVRTLLGRPAWEHSRLSERV